MEEDPGRHGEAASGAEPAEREGGAGDAGEEVIRALARSLGARHGISQGERLELEEVLRGQAGRGEELRRYHLDNSDEPFFTVVDEC